MELIVKIPEKICLDGEITLNGETFRARNININMSTGEQAEISATFFVDKINVVYGYQKLEEN